jgi:exosortase A-associated hydrolase 1
MPNKAIESAVSFGCEGDALVGILHVPAATAEIGIVVVVGGPQYRCGSHRQFVLLARSLAEAGFAALRFDVRGMGDSDGEPRTFEQVAPDIGVAIDALLRHQPQLTGVVLWGLCDGASAALLYLDGHTDPRVIALCLVNPWVRSQSGLARTHLKHYYLRRLGQRDFWSKLANGRVGLKAVGDLGHNLRNGLSASSTDARHSLPFQQRMARAAEIFTRPILVLLSGNDFTAREFEEAARSALSWKRVMVRANVSTVVVVGADHTFSSRAHGIEVTTKTVEWAKATLVETAISFSDRGASSQ